MCSQVVPAIRVESDIFVLREADFFLTFRTWLSLSGVIEFFALGVNSSRYLDEPFDWNLIRLKLDDFDLLSEEGVTIISVVP